MQSIPKENSATGSSERVVTDAKVSRNREMHICGEARFLSILISEMKEQLELVQRRVCHSSTKAEKILQGHKYKGHFGDFHLAKHGRFGVIPNVSDAGIKRLPETPDRHSNPTSHLTASAVTARLFAKSWGQLLSQTIRLLVKLLLLPSNDLGDPLYRGPTGSAINNLDLLRVRVCHGHPHVFQPYLVFAKPSPWGPDLAVRGTVPVS